MNSIPPIVILGAGILNPITFSNPVTAKPVDDRYTVSFGGSISTQNSSQLSSGNGSKDEGQITVVSCSPYLSAYSSTKNFSRIDTGFSKSTLKMSGSGESSGGVKGVY